MLASINALEHLGAGFHAPRRSCCTRWQCALTSLISSRHSACSALDSLGHQSASSLSCHTNVGIARPWRAPWAACQASSYSFVGTAGADLPDRRQKSVWLRYPTRAWGFSESACPESYVIAQKPLSGRSKTECCRSSCLQLFTASWILRWHPWASSTLTASCWSWLRVVALPSATLWWA